jgi:hypothetical protein
MSSERSRYVAETIENSLHLAAHLKVEGREDDRVIVSTRDGHHRFVISVVEDIEELGDCS